MCGSQEQPGTAWQKVPMNKIAILKYKVTYNSTQETKNFHQHLQLPMIEVPLSIRRQLLMRKVHPN